MGILFRNTNALSKNNIGFKDFTWLCDLDEAKGLNIDKTYRNPNAATNNFAPTLLKVNNAPWSSRLILCHFLP